MNTVKMMLMLVNFLTMISGVILLALSIFGLSAFSSLDRLYSTSLPTMILILGLFLILLSLLGFWGSLAGHTITIKSYLVLVGIVLAIQIVMGSIALARAGQSNELLNDAWDDAFARHPDALSHLEHTFNCCGYSSPVDRAVPADCSVHPHYGYTLSCKGPLSSSAERLLYGIGYWLMIVAALEALAVGIAISLYWQYPEEYAEGGGVGLLREPSYQPVARA